MSLNDPDLVKREYTSETGLLSRRSVYQDAVYEASEGPLEVTFATIAALGPRSLLEVGCGPMFLTSTVGWARSPACSDQAATS